MDEVENTATEVVTEGPVEETVTPEANVEQVTAPEDAFFDAASLSEELMPAYKQMQSAYTKKTQALAEGRDKVKAYDEFMLNPQAALQRLATQYGYQVGQPNQPAEAQDFQPQNWNEVLEKATAQARESILGELGPALGPLYQKYTDLQQSQTETLLDGSVPDWRQYEDEMKAVLEKHPTLHNDPVKLAEMSIPKEIRDSRAMQAALKKLESKVEGAGMSGTSTTKASADTQPKGLLTFQQSIEFAKRKLSKGR